MLIQFLLQQYLAFEYEVMSLRLSNWCTSYAIKPYSKNVSRYICKGVMLDHVLNDLICVCMGRNAWQMSQQDFREVEILYSKESFVR